MSYSIQQRARLLVAWVVLSEYGRKQLLRTMAGRSIRKPRKSYLDKCINRRLRRASRRVPKEKHDLLNIGLGIIGDSGVLKFPPSCEVTHSA